MENSLDQLIEKRQARKLYGILSGLFIYIIVGSTGLGLLHTFWPDYAIASKDKSYTLEMLLPRFLMGILASVLAALVTTKISKDTGQNA